MIFFGIPLRAKGASNDWDKVVRVFNRTLFSVYRQTDPDFMIFVACHDIPELYRQYDGRVKFLVSDQPVPTNSGEMMLDKGWKVSMIAQQIRQKGGGYTMMVDSDDLISNRIAEYVNKHPGENGFLGKYGYLYNEGEDYVKKIWAPHRICGSCSIVNYSVEDLPDRMPQNLWDDTLKEKWIVRKSHRVIPKYLEEHGRKLLTIPFPTTVYVRNTGDNHSMLSGSDLNLKRKAEMCLRRKINTAGKINHEFGFQI